MIPNLGVICFGHHMLHHDGKLEITGEAGKWRFRRILENGDRVEELGEYEMLDEEASVDLDSDPRGSE